MKFSKCCNTCSTEANCKTKCFLCNFELTISPNLAIIENSEAGLLEEINGLKARIWLLEEKLKELV